MGDTVLRGAIIGSGFWSNFQIAAWKELQGVEIVAVYNRTKSKAEGIARKFGIPAVYDDVKQLLDNEKMDFVDIITDADTHLQFTKMAADKGLMVICQKPMASTRAQAEEMLDLCKKAGVKLFIHENFRWQAPIRAFKKAMDSGVIGKIFKANVSFCTAFPVYQNQPFLAKLENLILTDLGSHILDISRFLFGEPNTLYCLTKRVNPEIKGEDVANVLMEMDSGVHCYAEMSFASLFEKEQFPQTLVLAEGEKGSLHLTHDFTLKTTTRQGTVTEKVRPVRYPWVDPDYSVVHSSIVDCNRDILNGLKGGYCETTGEDNFRTVTVVWDSYRSAKNKSVIHY